MAFTGGLSLKMGDGGNPENFNLVGFVFSIPAFGAINEALNVTGWDSPAEEYRAGVEDANEINLDIYRILNAADQESLIASVNNRNRVNFQLSFNDQTTTEVFNFSLTLSRWQILPATEAAHALQITGKINAATVSASYFTPATPGDWYYNLNELAGDLTSTVGGPVLTGAGGPEPVYNQSSLRSDSAGSSILFSPAAAKGVNSYPINILASGLAFEFIIQPLSAGTSRGGSVTPGFSSSGNTGFWKNLWVCRFDDWGAGGGIKPKFLIVKRGQFMNTLTNYSSNTESQIIGANDVVFGNTYHFLATIRPSNNTIELWINGVSQGSASISPTWFTHRDGSPDPLDGSAVADLILGETINDASARFDELKVHFLEADQAFATQQSAIAAIS